MRWFPLLPVPGAIAAWTLGACLAAQDAATVTLAHSLAAGARTAFAIDVDTRIEFDGGQRPAHLHFVLHFVAEVGAPAASGADVACRLLRIQADVVSPAARVQLDSADPREKTGPLRQLAGLVDATFHVHVDGRGAIARVDVPPAVQAMAKEGLGTGFDVLLAAWFVPLPAGPVGVGASWQGPVALCDPRLSDGAPVQADHRLVQIEGGRAKVVRTFEMPAPPKQPGICFAVKEARGDVVFDIAAGHVVTAETFVRARATREDGTGGTAELRVRAVAEPLPPPAPAPPAEPLGCKGR